MPITGHAVNDCYSSSRVSTSSNSRSSFKTTGDDWSTEIWKRFILKAFKQLPSALKRAAKENPKTTGAVVVLGGVTVGGVVYIANNFFRIKAERKAAELRLRSTKPIYFGLDELLPGHTRSFRARIDSRSEGREETESEEPLNSSDGESEGTEEGVLLFDEGFFHNLEREREIYGYDHTEAPLGVDDDEKG